MYSLYGLSMDEKNNHRRERFQRLATKRTNGILERLRVLGHCSNRSLYDYSDEDVKKIFSVIEAELKTVRMKFHKTRKTPFQL